MTPTDEIPVTPPVEPVATRGRNRPAWPSVIGVLCIIYAILGLFANACNSLNPWLQGPMLAMVGINDVEMPMALKLMSLIGGALGIILGILLFIGAIGLLKRRRSGYKLVMSWVVARVALAVVGIFFAIGMVDDQALYQIRIQEAMVEMAESRGGSAASVPLKTEEEISSSTLMWTMVGTTVVLIFPIVIGFVMSTRTKRAYVATWGSDVT